MSLRFQATAAIADCLFQDNTAGHGGAIYLSVPTALAGITITGTSRFVSNHADDDGGAIYNSGGSLNLTDTDFVANTARLNGGAVHTKTGAATLLRVHFGWGNRAAGPLGAHLVANEAGATVTLTNCLKDDPADIFVVLV